ncbi:Crp/Fnr family transcriptional regulator [Desulfoscipio geothermicus]|uniref:cAMP-binding domain of CRP or a regulatory subunit of cAMP-dependent protein kinases n=1 Tax=Desulfoscipio geothermicus DSM 3669 TaxID=1121426 RepID=A0A1I6EFZ7_9FIRM|nr:Crp/Fnr family transcriptional regulator [Desulfoscipio geothermicus]SFR16458.1 cAMP-binding domain of CRP or a regulatory subunit of cAMP-dependent protein kinases [Desulfoscipio geothermicus DSM 3669]
MDLFEGVQLNNIRQYQEFFQEYSFERKEIIFSPGKYPKSIFLVLKGKVRIFLSYPQGKEFTLSVLQPGDVYSGHTRAFGQALSAVKLAMIPINVFKDMLISVPGLVFGLVTVLGDALKGSIDVIESLVFEEAGVRLTSLIREWAQQSGTSTDEGILITLDFTREEISSMIGSSRQTLATLLKELSSAGLIEIKKKTLIVKDLEGVTNFFK